MATKLQSKNLYSILQSELLDANATHQAYNALDSAITLRVFEALAPKIAASPHAQVSYSFTRAMQGPAMAMMRRGIAVNQQVRQDETERYLQLRDSAQRRLDILADAIWGPEHYVVTTKEEYYETPIGKRGLPLTPKRRIRLVHTDATRPRGLNPNSSTQLLAFFNIALGLPVKYEIRKKPTGTERTPSANDKALIAWAKLKMKGPGIDRRDRTMGYVNLAAPFVSLILTIRDADKSLQVLRSTLDPDGRMRCSYNVVGTKTGRWSSSKNAYGRGWNLQTITESMRRMFCADDGYTLVSTDLEQAEPRVVGGLVWQATGDRTYLDACLSGDIHTEVAAMSYTELSWPTEKAGRRAIADQPCPDFPVWTYREVSKRLSNGTNYFGTPFGLSHEVGVPQHVVSAFQERYFSAFPSIRKWQLEHIKPQLQERQFIETPLGRGRWFFGRPTEDSTLRDAISFPPQSTVAEILNLIMWRVWRRSLLPSSHPQHLPIQLLLQNHDAFIFQTLTSSNLPTVISSVNAEFLAAAIPLQRGDQHESLVIPGEFVTGFNWGYADPKCITYKDGNVDGLSKWRGADTRQRQQAARPASSDWLSRPLRAVY